MPDGQESFKVSLIKLSIAVDFCAPELLVTRWKSEELASGVHVPETSIYENSHSPAREDDIWSTW